MTLILFTCVSFTWYVALQGENIRAFLPVHVPREAKFRHDLESPLAQGDAVLRPDTHVSPVKPLHAGGARRASVHGCSCVCAGGSGETHITTGAHREAATARRAPSAAITGCGPALTPANSKPHSTVTGLLSLVTIRLSSAAHAAAAAHTPSPPSGSREEKPGYKRSGNKGFSLQARAVPSFYL